jgi:ATP-dependent protease HslVU (ClpYQ) peptidase subunit
MTCVVGLIADNGDIVFGADSLVTNDAGGKLVNLDRKIFVKGQILIGYCGAVRHGQIVKHLFDPPALPRIGGNLENYIHRLFIPKLRKCFTKAGIDKLPDISLLVGVRGRLFVLEEDYSVVEAPDAFAAIGHGADYALGVLYATKVGKKDTPRITQALEASAHFCNSVGKPFHFERLSTHKPKPRKR